MDTRHATPLTADGAPVVVFADGAPGVVFADDGVPLATTSHGPADAPVTVVFAHGHCLRSDCWSALRVHLAAHWGNSVRTVVYDHRGHGRSGTARPETYTVDQLGRDLRAVLAATAPTGRVVLVGHSMGGMAILSYARQFPQSLGDTVVGAALIATAANGVADIGLGRLLRSQAVTFLRAAVRRAPRTMEVSRRFGRLIGEQLVDRRGRELGVRAAAVAAVITNDATATTMAGFAESLLTYDEARALPDLSRIPTLVLCGSADRLTPFAHSAALAGRLADCDLVRLDGAGHSVINERAADVAHAVAALVTRAAGHHAAESDTRALCAA